MIMVDCTAQVKLVAGQYPNDRTDLCWDVHWPPFLLVNTDPSHVGEDGHEAPHMVTNLILIVYLIA